MSNSIRAVAALVLVLALLGAYVAGYFCLPVETSRMVSYDIVLRIYPYKWLAIIFALAAKVETWLTGVNMETAWLEGNATSDTARINVFP